MENIEKTEIWKDLKEYPNYQISNLGRVKNSKTNRILAKRKGYEIILTINGKRISTRLGKILPKYFPDSSIIFHNLYTNTSKENSIWRDVKNYEYKYEINQYGEVRNKQRGNVLTITSKYTVILSKKSIIKEFSIVNLLHEVFKKDEILIENKNLVAKCKEIIDLDGEIWKHI